MKKYHSFILQITILISFLTLQTPAQKYVSIFYACWVNEALNTTFGDDVYIMGETPYSPYPQWNWWGKPLYAETHGDGTIKNNYRLYFDSPDNPNNELIDWHAELLFNAGIDYITLDLTNGTQTNIVNGAKAICQRYEERYSMGLDSPKIVFWVQDSLCLKVVEEQIFNVYRDEIFFEYLDKKLVNVAGGNVNPAIPDAGVFGKYTCRRMWGLNNSGNYWQFKVNSSTPPPPFYFNGKPEQMCAPVATQATYMTLNGISPTAGAVGRQNGDYFIKYMDAAIAADVKFIFIHSWNEWTAQNFGTPETPVFVDLWKTEYSSDIEPMTGGHGWYYYNLMCQKISEFKGTTNVEQTEFNQSGDDLSIEQNYPNPFNNSTKIIYHLGSEGSIEILLYDINGNEVFREDGRFLSAGEHSFTIKTGEWASGVYIFRIKQSRGDGRLLIADKKIVYLK